MSPARRSALCSARPLIPNSKKGVVVLGVAEASDNIGSVQRFALAGHLTYPMVLDSQGGTFWRYNVGHYPISPFSTS